MTGSMDNWLVSLVGFLPFFLVLVIFILYLLTRSWQREIRKGLNQYRTFLRQSQEASSQIRNSVSLFSSSDPEPYGRLSQALSDKLTEIDQNILSSYHQFAALNQELRSLNQAKLVELWHLPWEWYQLKGRLVASGAGLLEINKRLADAQITEDQINGLSWDISQQCHELAAKIQQSDQLLDDARDLYLDEEEVIQMKSKLSDWKNTIESQIPVFYFSTDLAIVTEKADKNTTSIAYRIVQTANLPVDEIRTEAINWIKRAREFAEILEQLSKKKEEVIGLVTGISNQEISPVSWMETKEHISELVDKIQNIGNFEVRRTSSQLDTVANKGKIALTECDSLIAYVIHVKNLCNEVTNLWMTPELQQAKEWIRRSLDFDSSILEYHPDNWRGNLPQDVVAGIQELEIQHQKILPRGQTNPIRETELEAYASGVRTLYELHQHIRPRYSEFQARLNMIKQTEKEVREQLVQALGIVQKTKPLVSSNSFLRRTIGSELNKIDEQLIQAKLSLDQAAVGVVEKKANKTFQLMEKTSKSFGKWLTGILEENKSKIQSLDEDYYALTQTVKLDEPFIMQASKFLEQIKPLGLPQGKTAPSLLELSRDLFKANEIWQSCDSLQKGIHDIANPVLERIRKTESNRQVLIASIEKAGQLMPEKATWPPTTQFLTDEHRSFDRYEDQWKSIHQSKTQAMALVSQLSDLSEHYYELTIKLRQKIEQASKEQDKIREYEKKLAESKRLWIRVAESNSSKRTIKDDVNGLLVGIEREFDDLKKRYEKGGLPYSGALSALRVLCRKIDDTLMPVEGNQVIDINGVIQRRIY